MQLARALKGLVRGLDVVLSRVYGIYPYSQAPGCILRLATGHSPRHMVLSDGTEVNKGDHIGELHLWNERIPRLSARGPTLGWALTFQRSLRRSLEELAAYASAGPGRLGGVRAFRGVGVLMPGAPVRDLAGRLGLEVIPLEPVACFASRIWRSFGAFWENGFHLALIWAYNAPSLKTKSLADLGRIEIWVSLDRLLSLYGRNPSPFRGTFPR